MDKTSDAQWMVSRLEERFGSVAHSAGSPVETLVLTILSQNTTDVNRDRAYASLLERFGTLEAVADADPEDIADAIRIGGLQEQKARSVSAALHRARDARGHLSLEFLRDAPVEEALSWLLDLPGVGRKTAGIVLLFSFAKAYFPIDTHIRRVLTRVGWIRGSEEPHRRVNALVDRDASLLSNLHLQLIRLGRTLCKPRDPLCGECPIRARCRHGKESL
jgi:endonuclease-3